MKRFGEMAEQLQKKKDKHVISWLLADTMGRMWEMNLVDRFILINSFKIPAMRNIKNF